MDVEDLKKVQLERANIEISCLISACRLRFLNAALLLELFGPRIDVLQDLGIKKSYNFQFLVEPYSILCDKYIQDVYSSQGHLFKIQSAENDWLEYFYEKLMPCLISNNEVVRNILRSLGALPCKNPSDADNALIQYFSLMTMPGNLPLWAPKDY